MLPDVWEGIAEPLGVGISSVEQTVWPAELLALRKTLCNMGWLEREERPVPEGVVMRLNHINLCASDVPAMTGTLERHFGYRVLELGKVPDVVGVLEAGSDYAMLQGQDGSYIVVSQIDPPEPGASAYPPHFHFGVMQDSADAVRAKHAELAAAGFEPGEISDGFEVFGASWTAFYCAIGDGLDIEVNHRTRSEVLDGVQQDGVDGGDRGRP